MRPDMGILLLFYETYALLLGRQSQQLREYYCLKPSERSKTAPCVYVMVEIEIMREESWKTVLYVLYASIFYG